MKSKSFGFAVKTVNLYKYLCNDKKEFVLSKQLLRSGTAVGALVREAEHAESRADFIHKMAIAQKECNESIYWIELIKETLYIDNQKFEEINTDAVEILKLITSIIKSTKRNL